MTKVYVLNKNGSTEPMDSIHCKNEDLELQRILEINPDLVPGEQINPSDPRKWLIVKREMPVPDPDSGANRWSVDLFMVDQDAMPTFIECKRYKDSRARREVVGQMLEYAANGHYYWSKDELREYAEQTAEKTGISIEEEIRRLRPEESDTVDAFFEMIQDNLREGQVRLVFFLEEAPQALKSIVDFLNGQMERSEVLLVEARQYEYESTKIVTPLLFGYTEEARKVKKTVSISSGQRRKWDKETFFNDAREKLSDDEVKAIELVYEKSQTMRCELSWGSGKINGSFTVIWPYIGKYSILSIYSNGGLSLNFGSFRKDDDGSKHLKIFKEHVENILEFLLPENYKERYISYQKDEWVNKVDKLIDVLDSIYDEGDPTT